MLGELVVLADGPNATPVPDLVMWSGLVGFGLPPIVAIINQPSWPGWARAFVTVVLCVLAGGGTAWFEGSLTDARWTTAVLIVLTAAVASYRMFWRPSQITDKIEKATSGSGEPRPSGIHRY